MAGNTFGTLFRITTFGESHGNAVGVLIDGVRPGRKFSLRDIQAELNRRRPGQSRVTTRRAEPDRVEILSGVFKGKTTGTPLCMIIRNTDQDSRSYEALKNLFRPGHAGYTYLMKYGIHDYRGGGRASGRETAGRVAAGAVARAMLKKRGIDIYAYTLEAAGIRARRVNRSFIERNPMRCPDPLAADQMLGKIERLRKKGDSAGGIVEAVVRHCPPGLGEPVFDKLEADLARSLMSVPAVRGFEIGSGFAAARMKGSEHNDTFCRDKKTGRIRTNTNHAGGILGGISSGEDIVVRIAVKPTSSIGKRQTTVDTRGRKHEISITGRHDPCICPRIVPVVESMIALVLSDHLMRQHLLRPSDDISRLRSEIDLIDDNLLILLDQRQELVRRMGKSKKRKNLPLTDQGREKEILGRTLPLLDDTNLDPQFVRRIFGEIFRYSGVVQRSM